MPRLPTTMPIGTRSRRTWHAKMPFGALLCSRHRSVTAIRVDGPALPGRGLNAGQSPILERAGLSACALAAVYERRSGLTCGKPLSSLFAGASSPSLCTIRALFSGRRGAHDTDGGMGLTLRPIDETLAARTRAEAVASPRRRANFRFH